MNHVKSSDDVQLSIMMAVQMYDETMHQSDVLHYSITCDDVRSIVHETTDGRVVVAFRCYSESLLARSIYLLSHRRRFLAPPMGHVHTGLLRQYTGIHRQVLHYLQSTYGLDKHIIVTGYSFGGALSVLFAAEVASTIPTMYVNCYPICAPRIGDKQFVMCTNDLSNLSILRIQPVHDGVTPSAYQLFGFVHTPAVAYIYMGDIRSDKVAYLHMGGIRSITKTNNTRNRIDVRREPIPLYVTLFTNPVVWLRQRLWSRCR